MGVPESGSSDPGQNVALTISNTPVRASPAPAPLGLVAITSDPGNTVQIHIGKSTAVTAGTTGKGIRITAGSTIILPAADAKEFYFVAGSPSQNVGVLAL